MKQVIYELKKISYIALPILAAFLSHLLIGFADSVMAGRYSSNDLAAISIGASIWLPIYLFFSAIISALTPLLASMVGEGEKLQQKNLIKTGKILSVAIGFILMGVIILSTYFIDIVIKDENIFLIAKKYLIFISFGMPAFMLYRVYSSIFEAYGKTIPIMISSFSGALVNIPLNYIFIYGKFGLPVFGGVGCGIASFISSYVMLFVISAIYKNLNYISKNFKNGNINRKFAKKIIALGIPIGTSTFLEAFIFGFGSILLAPLGPVSVAAHQIALNFISTIFMIPMSLSIAISVRISQFYGKKDLQYTTFIWKYGALYVEIIAIISSIIMWICSDYILGVYTKDHSVLAIAKPLFMLAILFHTIDAFQVTASNILKGYHNTRVPMYVNIISYWIIALPLGYILVYIVKLGPIGFWMSLVAGIINSAVILCFFLVKKYNFNIN